jgi:hypothetical protein
MTPDPWLPQEWTSGDELHLTGPVGYGDSAGVDPACEETGRVCRLSGH